MATSGTVLIAERARTLTAIAALERELAELAAAAAGSNADDEHDPEGATLAVERARVAGRLVDARAHLTALDDALERVAAGTYGTCARCGGPIAPGRLEARPTATTCIACAGGTLSA